MIKVIYIYSLLIACILLAAIICGFRFISTESNLFLVMSSPSLRHFAGTDDLGRDVLIRTLQGLSLSLLIGLTSSFLATFIGTVVGFFAGHFAGAFDLIISRIIEILSSLPQLILVTLMTLFFSDFADQGFWSRILVLSASISCVQWMNTARVVRVQCLTLSKQEFIEGARAIGASNFRIFFKHEIPHLNPTLLRLYLSSLPTFMLFEGFLSFLGFGLQPPEVSLGTLLNEGWRHFSLAPRLLLVPGLFLFIILYYFQLCFREFESQNRHNKEDLA